MTCADCGETIEPGDYRAPIIIHEICHEEGRLPFFRRHQHPLCLLCAEGDSRTSEKVVAALKVLESLPFSHHQLFAFNRG